MSGSPGDDGSKTPSVEQQRRQQAAAYQGAMEAIFSIVICVGAGYWADTAFETSPVWLIVGALVGFAAFVLRLVRMRPDATAPEGGSEGEEEREAGSESEPQDDGPQRS